MDVPRSRAKVRWGWKQAAKRSASLAALWGVAYLHLALLPSPRSLIDLAYDAMGYENASPTKRMDEEGDGVFFWENARNCHVVENVCHVTADLHRWFYFTDEANELARRKKPHQPSLFVNLTENADGDTMDGQIYFDVSSTLPKPTLPQLRANATDARRHCTLANIDNHVVLQSVYSDMVGEFFVRILLPLSQLMGSENRYSQHAAHHLQFHMHLTTPKSKMLDAHELFLSGLPTNNAIRDWRGMFEDDSDSKCECYRRLVLCGYRRVENVNARCKSGWDRIGLPDNIASALCDKGIDLRFMQMLGNESLVDEALQNAGISADAERSMVVKRVKDAPTNVALDKPANASSSEDSHPARHAFDGDTNTRWSSDYSDEQFLEVDLGELHRVEKVVIDWERAGAESYEIQVSIDRSNWTTAWSKRDGNANMGTVESALANITCRYVRMHGLTRATAFGFSIFEMEVYGTRVDPTQPGWLDPISGEVTAPDELITLACDFDIKQRNNTLTECGYNTPAEVLKRGGCHSYQELRQALLQTYARKYTDLPKDVDAYRTKALLETLPAGRRANNDIDHRNWKFIGLTQRKKRRSWLNLNETIAHCNARYFSHQILCIEVNVETMAHSTKGPGYTQLTVHQSLDALIGVHGAQMTQAILLPKGATVVELLPWVPQNDYFGTGRDVWGSWVQTTTNPTPLGIIYHNTDLNHLGYSLGRDSVPLCEDVSNTVMHDFSDEEDSEDRERVATELEYCLLDEDREGDNFRWDDRNFNVDIAMIDRFLSTFILPQRAANATNVMPICNDWLENGQPSFVLYNVWCTEANASSATLQHFYREEDEPSHKSEPADSRRHRNRDGGNRTARLREARERRKEEPPQVKRSRKATSRRRRRAGDEARIANLSRTKL